MKTDLEASPVCPECGRALAAKDGVCSRCQTPEPQNDWEKERNRLKTLWVLATVFCWFSLIFQAGLLILDGTLNLVIVSIILGTMVMGIVLKIRLSLHVRKRPED